jgi:hypothetical protein
MLAYNESLRLEIATNARRRLETELADPNRIWAEWKQLFDGLAVADDQPLEAASCDLLFVGWIMAANFDPANVRFLGLIMEPDKTSLFP